MQHEYKELKNILKHQNSITVFKTRDQKAIPQRLSNLYLRQKPAPALPPTGQWGRGRGKGKEGEGEGREEGSGEGNGRPLRDPPPDMKTSRRLRAANKGNAQLMSPAERAGESTHRGSGWHGRSEDHGDTGRDHCTWGAGRCPCIG